MNILLLAFEGEGFAAGRMARDFKAMGHGVFVAQVDHFSVTHSRGEIFDYYRSLGLGEDEFAHLGPVFEAVNRLPEDLPRSAIDFDYLKAFEARYCHRFALQQMLAMDTLFSQNGHHRDIYYHPKNKAVLLKALELHCRWLEDIYARRQFDVVYTMNYQYFHKAAAYSMAHAMGIPYLVAMKCRIRDLHLLFDNYCLGAPDDVIAEMGRLAAAGDPCAEAADYIAEIRHTGKAPYVEFLSTDERIRQKLDLRGRFRELAHFILRHPRRELTIHKHYRGLRPNYFLPNYWSFVRTATITLWRRIEYFRLPQLNRRDLPDGPFVYFPLHVIPESTVMTLADTLDELECVFQLSKRLPSDWRIVVKVNPAMLMTVDTHPNRYYLDMDKLPNVQFISPLVSSGEILPKASAVACIAGTALLEAAMHGKPGLRWGRADFDVVDSISLFDPETVGEALAKGEPTNLKEYVQACMNLGAPLRGALIGEFRAAPLDPTEQTEFDRQIGDLERLILDYMRRRPSAAAAAE